MTSKPETVLQQIKKLENQNHRKSFLEFYAWFKKHKPNRIEEWDDMVDFLCEKGIYTYMEGDDMEKLWRHININFTNWEVG